MSGIISYLRWRGEVPFSCAPLNEVDYLIFTQIVYLNFDGIVPGMQSGASISLEKAGELFLDKWKERDAKEEVPVLIRDCVQILQEVLQAKRFAACRMTKYINEKNEEEEYQFSAMKLLPGDGSSFLAFRGTDTSRAGWKENFNMSFLKATPGQEKAVWYVRNVLPAGCESFVLGGHSKGGNLAMYAALKSEEKIQRRIRLVYNFDGPGFTEEMVAQSEYERLKGRVRRYLPEFSVIGILLDREENYKVVKSCEKGLQQHRAITWEVLGISFVYEKKLSRESLFWAHTLKTWVRSLQVEERRVFVEIVFSVFDQAGIEHPGQLKKMTRKRMKELIKALDRLDVGEKKIMLRLLHMLLEEMEKNR